MRECLARDVKPSSALSAEMAGVMTPLRRTRALLGGQMCKAPVSGRNLAHEDVLTTFRTVAS
jgi:hypothetical protein